MDKQAFFSGVRRALAAVALLVLFAGCSTILPFDYPPSNRIQIGHYPPGNGATNLVFGVLPVGDSRTDHSSSRAWTLLAYVPLVPFVPYHEYALPHTTPDALRDAVATHIRESGLGKAVLTEPGAAARSGCDYSVKVTFHDLGTTGYATCYCLGIFAGYYVTGYGAPNEYSAACCNARVQVFDRAGRTVLDRTYESEGPYSVGSYYNLNPYTFVGINIVKVLNAACRDIAATVR